MGRQFGREEAQSSKGREERISEVCILGTVLGDLELWKWEELVRSAGVDVQGN